MFGNPFYRTSLDYWQKSTLNYNWYWVLTVFLGWTGLDMLYLRSPLMAVVKLIVNTLTLGYWWMYDAMEATFNKKQVEVAGPTMPFYGPLGIAGGMFMGSPGTPEDLSKHAYFLIYGIIVVFTGLFGGDSFLVGDKMSGYIRLISLFSFIFTPIAFIWWIYKLYLYFIRTDQLFDQNYEFFGAPVPKDASLHCPNVLETATAWAVDTTGVVLDYIPVVSTFAPFLRTLATQLRAAYGIASTVVDTGIQVAQKGPELMQAIQSGIELNPNELPATASSSATPLSTTPTSPPSPTPPSNQVAQSGGGEITGSSAFGSLILMGTLLFVIVSGGFKTVLNIYKKSGTNGKSSETSESGGQRSDDPPNPGNARGTVEK